jgi:hypothetical protein
MFVNRRHASVVDYFELLEAEEVKRAANSPSLRRILLQSATFETNSSLNHSRRAAVTDSVDQQNFRRQIDAHPAIQPAFAIGSPQVRRQIVRSVMK